MKEKKGKKVEKEEGRWFIGLSLGFHFFLVLLGLGYIGLGLRFFRVSLGLG